MSLALQSSFLNTGPPENSILSLLSHLHVYIKNGFLVNSIWLSLFFNIKSDICLLIGVLRLFTFNLIIVWLRFLLPSCQLFSGSICSLFLFQSFSVCFGIIFNDLILSPLLVHQLCFLKKCLMVALEFTMYVLFIVSPF